MIKLYANLKPNNPSLKVKDKNIYQSKGCFKVYYKGRPRNGIQNNRVQP